MESTIITILIAIAIMGFQIYNEKKKKENARARSAGITPQSEDPHEKLRRELSSLFAGIVPEEETEYEPYLQPLDTAPDSVDVISPEDPFESISKKQNIPLDTVPANEGESLTMGTFNHKIAKSEQEDVTGDIYDSKAISAHEIGESPEKKGGITDKDFNPRLFILYSEIAAPKFRE